MLSIGVQSLLITSRLSRCRLLGRSLNYCRFSTINPSLADITGNVVSGCHSKQHVELIDESIMNLILYDELPLCISPDVPKDLLENPFPMFDILSSFSLLRYIHPTPSTSISTSILSALRRLETAMKDNTMTLREVYFSAALLEYTRGNYAKAGGLLESSLLRDVAGRDELAVRLAQDCYILAGDHENAYRCVTRSQHKFDEGHFLQGNFAGMLSGGLAQTNRLAEAEEVGMRALDSTKGKDAWALHALCSAYQGMGKSAEILSISTINKNRFRGPGRILIFYHQGLANVIRANYGSALGCIDDMVETMCEAPETQSAFAFSLVSTLLWQISLNAGEEIIDDNIDKRWNSLELIAGWTNVSKSCLEVGMQPMHKIALMMALTSAKNIQQKRKDKEMEMEKKKEEKAKEVDETQTSASSPPLEVVEQPQPVPEEESMSLRSLDVFGWFIQSAKNILPKDDYSSIYTMPNDIDAAQAIEEFHTLNNSGAASTSEWTSQLQQSKFPFLSSLQPRLSYQSRFYDSSSDLDRQSKAVGNKILAAIVSFSDGDYKKAASLLTEVMPDLHYLGTSLVDHNIIEQTLIESLIRSGDLSTAQIYLMDRTNRHPNDGQAWRRLAKIASRTGQRGLFNAASESAYQLGIGQSGYGGKEKGRQ